MIIGFHDGSIPGKENVFICNTSGRYYHDFFDNFYRILCLKQLGEKFTVIITSPYDLLDNGLPNGLKKDYINNKKKSFDQPCEYWISFLDYFNIDYQFINVLDLHKINISSAYYFFVDETRRDINMLSVIDNNNYIKLRPKIFDREGLIEFGFAEFFNSTYYINASRYMKCFFPNFEVVKGKRIYISRNKLSDRSVKDENQLENFLIKNGFEIKYFEEIDIMEQIKAIQESEIIITMIGGALSNFIFSQSDINKKIIIIRPNRFTHSDSWEDIFNYLNINYKMLDYNLGDNNLLELLDMDEIVNA